MFRLKYSCPFHGHSYPFFISMLVMPLTSSLHIYFGMLTGLGSFWIIPMGLLGSVFVLLCFFTYFQQLSPAEQDLCNECPPALWYPLPESHILHIRSEMLNSAPGILHALGVAAAAGVLTLFCAFGRNRHSVRYRREVTVSEMMPFAIIVAAAAFIIVIFISARRRAWAQIDESATCLIVPVHHSYDITHHGKHGRTWIENYIVCYLPDGRYVLHNRKKHVDVRFVIFIRFRNSVIWRPYYYD